MNEEKTKNLFFSIIFFSIVLIIALFLIVNPKIKLIVLISLSVILLIYFLFKLEIVLQLKDYERAVIFRFGKVNRVGGPGWTLLLPFIEKSNIVTLRTQVIDVPVQQIITKDNIRLTIDAVLFISVNKEKESVINSVVKVEDYKKAATFFVISTLRDVLGEFDLMDVISNTENINQKLTEALTKVAKEWGIKVNSVEMKDIQIPEEIIESMHKQKAAVQKKLAVFEEVESERAKITAIREATETLSDKTILYYYIKALEKIGEGESTKLIFPLELTSLLHSISNKINTGKDLSLNKTEKEKLKEYLPVIKKYIRTKK